MAVWPTVGKPLDGAITLLRCSVSAEAPTPRTSTLNLIARKQLATFPGKRNVLPKKSRTNGVAGMKVNFFGRTDLFELAEFHDGDAVRQAERFDLIVGDEDHRDVDALLQRFQLAAHFLAQLRVKIAQRFVEQQNFRRED